MGCGSWYLFLREHRPDEQGLLLDHGVTTKVRDIEGYTPLIRAAQAKSWPMVKLLLEQGRAPNRSTTMVRAWAT